MQPLSQSTCAEADGKIFISIFGNYYKIGVLMSIFVRLTLSGFYCVHVVGGNVLWYHIIWAIKSGKNVYH